MAVTTIISVLQGNPRAADRQPTPIDVLRAADSMATAMPVVVPDGLIYALNSTFLFSTLRSCGTRFSSRAGIGDIVAKAWLRFVPQPPLCRRPSIRRGWSRAGEIRRRFCLNREAHCRFEPGIDSEKSPFAGSSTARSSETDPRNLNRKMNPHAVTDARNS